MIYFIRHGQTEYNAEQRYQGHRDSRLTALGRAQAKAMGERLGTLIDPATVALFTSPLGRAQETAQIIAEAAGITADPIVDAGLAEISLGSWDGLTVPEIEAGWPGVRAAMHPHGWFFETPDGDRYDSFSTRLAEALARVVAHPAPARVMVSHGVVSRVMRGLHARIPREEAIALETPQGVIYRFDEGEIVEIDCRN